MKGIGRAWRLGVGREAPLALTLTLTLTVGAGCAGAPWFLGEPLDGKPSVPPTSRAETVADHRRKLAAARKSNEKVIELAELDALEKRGALDRADVRRFGELLRERARDWVVLRRPIPLAADLRHVVALEPGRALALSAALRNAERAAGDRWLALGENARAEEEYRRAERLGAGDMLFRLRAAWGASPADLDRPLLAQALTVLPERALAPFTVAYLDVLAREAAAIGGGEGEVDAAVLRRAWQAARVYGPEAVRLRIEALPAGADFPAELGQTAVTDATTTDPMSAPESTIGRDSPSSADARPPADPLAQPPEPRSEQRLYGRASLARLLLPLARVTPDLSAPGARSREWSEWLLAEDPTSPDSLEFAALVDARAGRVDGAERKLIDLVFYSPDRAEGYARAARVWERAGQGRRACAAWDRSAHAGPVDDPRWCALIDCLGRNPGSGDRAAAIRHLRERAPWRACAGVALPTGDDPRDAGGGPVGPVGRDG